MPKNESKKVKTRCKLNVNKTVFGNCLADHNWSTLYRTTLCDDKLDYFVETINTGLECFFPSKIITLHVNDKPWITPEFKEIIKGRQKAYHDRGTQK